MEYTTFRGNVKLKLNKSKSRSGPDSWLILQDQCQGVKEKYLKYNHGHGYRQGMVQDLSSQSELMDIIKIKSKRSKDRIIKYCICICKQW